MPLNQNPHQAVTRCECVGFSMHACGFSVAQMRQFCLFTYLSRSKSASFEIITFFFLPKSASSVDRRPSSQRCSGGRIKLLICQIRYELNVTIHKICTGWKNGNVRWRTLYMCIFILFCPSCLLSLVYSLMYFCIVYTLTLVAFAFVVYALSISFTLMIFVAFTFFFYCS